MSSNVENYKNRNAISYYFRYYNLEIDLSNELITKKRLNVIIKGFYTKLILKRICLLIKAFIRVVRYA